MIFSFLASTIYNGLVYYQITTYKTECEEKQNVNLLQNI